MFTQLNQVHPFQGIWLASFLGGLQMVHGFVQPKQTALEKEEDHPESLNFIIKSIVTILKETKHYLGSMNFLVHHSCFTGGKPPLGALPSRIQCHDWRHIFRTWPGYLCNDFEWLGTPLIHIALVPFWKSKWRLYLVMIVRAPSSCSWRSEILLRMCFRFLSYLTVQKRFVHLSSIPAILGDRDDNFERSSKGSLEHFEVRLTWIQRLGRHLL